MAMRMALLLLFSYCATAALGAGFAHDKNFIVDAADQHTADAVIAAANRFRAQVAQEWLGNELPIATGRTIISVELSSREDRAFTWPIDSPERKFHTTWLVTSREKAAGSTLKHEIAHTVLNTHFPDRLPVAIEEGIASLYDDSQRTAAGHKFIDAYSRQNNWPRLQPILESRSITARDGSTYALMTSFAEYLLTRGDKATLLRFAVDGKNQGWNQSASQHYNQRSIEEMEQAWHAWAGQTTAHTASLDAVDKLPGSRF